MTIHYFIHTFNNFQILIANGILMKFGGHCENVKLQMGDYHLKNHIFFIGMGGCDIMLGEEWLRTLRPVTMDFKELYMRFVKGGHTYTLKGIQDTPPDIITSHHMKNVLKKGHSAIISQFHVIQGLYTTPLEPNSNMQQVLSNYGQFFELHKGLPPTKGDHNQNILLLIDSRPNNVFPYQYPFSQRNEIEKIIEEILVVGIIWWSTSHYSSLVVMVLNKEVDWRMSPDFWSLNQLTIKDKFTIPIIEDLLDELHGSHIFTKLNLCSGYHQICMKEVYIPKTTFCTHEGH